MRRYTAGVLAIAIAASGPVAAQILKPSDSLLSRLVLRSEKLIPSQPIVPLEERPSAALSTAQQGWTAFRRGPTADWKALVDERNGLIASAEGSGVAWIPGAGNSLPAAEGRETRLAALEAIARRELGRLAPLLGVEGQDLALNQGRSGQVADHLWLVDFDLVREGLVVEGARVVFRVNNGNLVQFGSENLPSPGTPVPPTKLDREQAKAVMVKYIGGLTSRDQILDAGSLHLLPANVGDAQQGGGFEPSKGRELVKVWQFVFRREGVLGTWRARVDAATGKLLELVDINDYPAAQATGGAASNTAAGTEVVRPVPFADLGAGAFTGSAGLYTFSAAPLTSTLNGQFVRIVDTCGAVSLTTDGSGNLLFGTAAGSNCVTPGGGGAGNTRSSRTSFYNLNRGKEIVRGWFPANAFVNGQLTTNVNRTGTCNGFWNGSTIDLFQAVGGSCGASGEEPGFILHEFGHGVDQNDGSGSEAGTGEAYGDVTAAMILHDSCVGPGFWLTNCTGYGDACTSCTGLRELDFARHASNTPATVANFTQPNCGGGGGPCGREVHCESYVPSQAIWDFANRDLPSPGSNAAWAVAERLWYRSRSTSTSAFSCTPGPTFTSNGCNLGSWWKTMRFFDDDDGDLTNGTPHGAALFAAFNRHGIACAADPGAGVTFAGCTPPPTPTLTLAPGNHSVTVNVSGSGVFDLFRNEIGCNAGFVKFADDFAGGTQIDNAVANGTAYFYQAIAHASGNEACASAPTPCLSVTPAMVPQIQVPGNLDLGATCAGTAAAGTLDVCNTGTSNLIVSAITSSNPSFSVTMPSSGYPVTVVPGSCFPFQAVFNPTATGPQSATLTIPSNDPATPNVTVLVSGSGTEPDIRVTGSTDFGVASAWTPAERTLAVCNTGGCSLSVTSAAGGCADFTLVSNPFPAVLAPGSCLDLVVGFTPVLPGFKSCGLTITSNDPDTPVVSRTLTARTPPFLSLHAGLVSPHGALHSVARQGSTLNLDFVYPFLPRWAWDVRLGLSRFDGRAANPDTDLATLSANAKFTLNPAAPVRVFLNGGLGLYHFDLGQFEAGGNLGLGLSVPAGPRFAFEVTYNYHSALTASPDLEYGQAQLGLLVSF